MKEKIIENLFFISLVSFCIEGSTLITVIGVITFCCCGIYIIKHQEDFLLEEDVRHEKKTRKERVKRVRKNRYHNAA